MMRPAELRRLRLGRAIKQEYLAALMQVSQSTVSRWERGRLRPSKAQARQLWRLLGVIPGDAALRRLVETSARPVHLICDHTHRLLAASPARERAWRVSARELEGRSLWGYASEAIVDAETRLEAAGWHESPPPAVWFHTGPNRDRTVPIASGRVLWERLCLADGAAVRLVTSLAADEAPPAHNLCVDALPAYG